VEYGINYDVDQSPFYEMLPERFPNEEQMFEFMYSYEKELRPNESEESLNKTAQNMVKVGTFWLDKNRIKTLPRRRFPSYPSHICSGEFGAFCRWKFRQLALDFR
jgi:hypothetical protein